MKKWTALLLLLSLTLLAGCGGNAPVQTTAAPTEPVDLQTVYEQLIASPNMPEMVVLEGDMQQIFCGIDPADCTQAVVAICGDSLRTDEIWLIEAVDADAEARIAALAEARLTAKGEESVTYSPEQYAVVQEAQTIENGNVFVLLVSPDAEALAQLYRTAAGI